MIRKEFIMNAISATAYVSLASMLGSCRFDEGIISDSNLDGQSTAFHLGKAVYLVSDSQNDFSKIAKSSLLVNEWDEVSELITYGYIKPIKNFKEISRRPHLREIDLSSTFRCVLFPYPIKTYIPQTYQNFDFQYTLYEDLKTEFTKKSIKF